MSRLPTPGSDDGTWGNVLNDYLSVAHNANGTLKSGSTTGAGAEQISNKGIANGYASLDGSGKVPTSQLPNVATGVQSVTATDSTIVMGGTSTDPTVGVGTIPESKVTNLTTDLAAKVPTSRTITAGTGLTGGGDLSADRTISANFGTGAGTVAQGNDSRIVSATPTSRQITAGTGLSGGGDLTADRTISVNFGTTAGTIAQGNDSRIVGAEQTTNKGAANGYAPLNASSQVPTTNLPKAFPPVVLTDAATITTDASLSNHFRVTLGGNRTLGAPTNAVDGQKVMWELIQDATGTRTLALDAIFKLGTDISAITLSTTANTRDFLGAVYNATANKWYVIAFVKGY